MRVEKVHLTVKIMKSLVPGRECRYCDTEVRGLQVWVGSRSITFYLRKRHEGHEYTIRLGNWPDIMLEEARKKAIEKLGALSNYGKADVPTGRVDPVVQDAIDYYFQSHTNRGTLMNARMLFRHFASWGNRLVKDITSEDLTSMYNRLRAKPTIATAAVSLLVSACRMLYRKLGRSYTPPVLGFKYYYPPPRKRYVTKDEMPRFFETLDLFEKEPRYAMRVDMIYMLLYTGARKMNVCEMRLEEISPAMLWTIPKEKYKGKRDQPIQLGEFETSIVEKYRAGRISGYVFPHEKNIAPALSYFFGVFCKTAGFENLHIHDIRRTLGTWMLSNGTPIAVVSKKLGNASIKITEQVYAHVLPDVSSVATDHAIAAMRDQNGRSS